MGPVWTPNNVLHNAIMYCVEICLQFINPALPSEDDHIDPGWNLLARCLSTLEVLLVSTRCTVFNGVNVVESFSANLQMSCTQYPCTWSTRITSWHVCYQFRLFDQLKCGWYQHQSELIHNLKVSLAKKNSCIT